MLLLNWVKRRWRSRGHGVHSPFAFRFITCVLGARGEYYASPKLKAMADARWCRLLFRLVCEFEPAGIHAVALTDDERLAISLADSRISVSEHGCGGDVYMTSVRGDVTLIRDIRREPERWAHLRSALQSGMTFTDGCIGIAVSRADLPRQDFEVNIL